MFGHLSYMPVVCLTHYKLQRDASYLNQSLSVRASSSVSIFLQKSCSWHFYHSHATMQALLQG